MKPIFLVLLLVQIGIAARADSDFFNSTSSVPSDLIAGQKPKTEPVPGVVAAEPAVAPAKAAVPAGKPAKKVDMPREVFVEWVDGDEVAAEKPAEGSDDRAPSGKATDSKSKRAAPEPKDIDQLLEQELKKPKKDSSEDDEHRFIEVN
ncbi:MAG: hypothetical protein K2X47_18700 [Bdellovibrionales bacterium]|nr:hypothetical protein [Bdellovibrionales bacterium]